MKRFKTIPKKSLGQNFLKDEDVLRKIIKAADLNETDNVVEVGPGGGFLTNSLIKKVKRVIAIEKDDRLASLLISGFRDNSQIKIINDDVLRMNLSQLIEKNDFYDYKIVANIPYYITGKLFRTILENKHRPKSIVIMIQKEVAERICAKEGKMNKFALLVKYFGRAQIICSVPRESFFPVPKVDSAVIKIEINDNNFNKNKYKELFRVIRIGFSNPRKILSNNLSTGLRIKKEDVKKVFDKIDLDINIRAQNLTLQKWRELSDELAKLDK